MQTAQAKSISTGSSVTLAVVWALGGALAMLLLAYAGLVSQDRVQATEFANQQKQVDSIEKKQDKIDSLITDVAVIRTNVENLTISVKEMKER